MARYKFDDCVDCRWKRRPAICSDCDYGEQFEDISGYQELRFDDSAFARADKSLTTDDDEPNFNPDDFVTRIGENEEDQADLNEDKNDDE